MNRTTRNKERLGMSKQCYGCQSTNIYIEEEVFDDDYIIQLYICDSCGVSNTRFEYYDDLKS